MRLCEIIVAVVALFAASPAHGAQPADPAPPMPSGRPVDESPRAMEAMFRFAPMWVPVSIVAPAPDGALPAPSAAYSMIWQPECQAAIGLLSEQKKSLSVINAKALAEAQEHAEQFKRLSPQERKTLAQAESRKPLPQWRQCDNELRKQIEGVLMSRQLQAFKDHVFHCYAVGWLYDAKIRQEIGFTPKQKEAFRRIAKERLARFQEVSMERADKLWTMLTPTQQTELPELVKHQGPTSAVLSLAWDLGFDPDAIGLAYPMLAEAPVRERLRLNAEQERQLQAVMADSAARVRRARQEARERLPEKSQRPPPNTNAEADERKQVEAILTSQQLVMLKEVNFRRQAALALGYPEKRKTIGITAQQTAEMRRVNQQTHDQLYSIDRQMLGRAMDILTPRQREQLREQVEQRGW